MSIAIQQIAVGGFDKNFSYVLFDTQTKDAHIVDPSGDVEKVFACIEHEKLNVIGILLTHSHFDHHEKLHDAQLQFKVPVFIHTHGKPAIGGAHNITGIVEGSQLPLGTHAVHVLHTPGHIADSVCYFVEAGDTLAGAPILVTGDTLFISRCGKTNERDVAALYESLQRLSTLPAETVIYPGHDYGDVLHATLAHECAHNPYLLAEDFAAFKELRLGS